MEGCAMVEEEKHLGTYSPSDKLAIALTCLAGVMAIVLFLVEKTPLTVVGLLVAMVILLVYPVLHFARRPLIRGGVLILAMVGTLVFGWFVWPKNKLADTVNAN